MNWPSKCHNRVKNYIDKRYCCSFPMLTQPKQQKKNTEKKYSTHSIFVNKNNKIIIDNSMVSLIVF